MVRGKKRLGYELNLEFLVKSTDNNSEGVVSITELTDDSDEPD